MATNNYPSQEMQNHKINSFIPNKKKDMEVTCIMSEYQAIDSSHPDYCMPKATPGNFVYELFGEIFSR